MTLKRRLKKIFDEILAETETNEAFAERLLSAIDQQSAKSKKTHKSNKRGRRRTAAVLDPVRVIETEGEDLLRNKLTKLDIEQLKDIVAEYGMDQAKLVMKWNTTSRIIDHIISTSHSRSKKGDAFR